MIPQLLRLKEILELTSLSRATIYREIAEGKFPKPIKISQRASGWLENDVFEWLQERIKLSEAGRRTR